MMTLDERAKLKSDIALAEDLLESKLGMLLDDFCGKNYKDENLLNDIRKEIEASGNPWGVEISLAKDIKSESLIMCDAFFVGFHLWGWFNYYKFSAPFDLIDDIKIAKEIYLREIGVIA